MKHYVKLREEIRVVQWQGQMTLDVLELVADHVVSINEQQRLLLDTGCCAAVGDWICSTPPFVISDEQLRRDYEEVNAGRRLLPPLDDEDHPAFFALSNMHRAVEILRALAVLTRPTADQHDQTAHVIEQLLQDLQPSLRVPDGWVLGPRGQLAGCMELATSPPYCFTVTIDFQLRRFRSAYAAILKEAWKPRKEYEGPSWRQKLVDDAVVHLHAVIAHEHALRRDAHDKEAATARKDPP